jgi:hypothetical protein
MNKGERRIYMIEYHKNNKEKRKKALRKYFYKRDYNITIDEYNKMFDSQNGCCKICGRHQSEFKQRLCVDHDHKTLKIRGLLCHTCNKFLGYINDDINKIINYIK